MSLTKVETIKKFNSLMNNFLKQISPLIGKSMQIYFNTSIKFNAMVGIESFFRYVAPFRNQVLKEDEKYFYDVENYSKNIKNIEHSHSTKSGSYLNEILKFKQIYEKIKDNERNRKNLWKYLKVLLLLSEDYAKMAKLSLPKNYGDNLLRL
jgi:hypothetical protein